MKKGLRVYRTSGLLCCGSYLRSHTEGIQANLFLLCSRRWECRWTFNSDPDKETWLEFVGRHVAFHRFRFLAVGTRDDRLCAKDSICQPTSTAAGRRSRESSPILRARWNTTLPTYRITFQVSYQQSSMCNFWHQHSPITWRSTWSLGPGAWNLPGYKKS
jgi:putative flippase GtrA